MPRPNKTKVGGSGTSTNTVLTVILSNENPTLLKSTRIKSLQLNANSLKSDIPPMPSNRPSISKFADSIWPFDLRPVMFILFVNNRFAVFT